MNKVVFDVGGTMIKYALMDNDGNVIKKDEIATPYTENGQDDFLEALAVLFEVFQDEADGVAVSMPGTIDSDTGFVGNPGALRYNANTPVAKLLEERIEEKVGRHIPVVIENDGKAAAVAELWKGNLQGHKNGVVMIIGTGIGGGIIVDGKVLKGKDNFAGEFSFLKSDLEENDFAKSFASVAATPSLIQRAASKKGVDHKTINGLDVFSWILNDNDPLAKEALEETANLLASQIYNLVAILNPDKVLLGGGISKQPLLLETVRRIYNQNLAEMGGMSAFVPDVEISTTKFYNDSNMIGALYNFGLYHPELMEVESVSVEGE